MKIARWGIHEKTGEGDNELQDKKFVVELHLA